MVASRHYCFTLNNPESNEVPIEWGGSYCSWQREEGDEGTPHLQGYIEFDKVKRLAAMKKLHGTCHWEVRRGTQTQAIEYTQKEDTRVEGFWEYGEKKKGQGSRSDLETVCEKIKAGMSMKDVVIDYGPTYVQWGRGLEKYAQMLAPEYDHDDVRGVWYWGKPGTGKSHSARAEYPGAYMKQQNKWFDGYGGQDAIILDDLDSNVLGHHLKIWADKYACTAEVKGAQVNLQHKAFVVTSNYHPDSLWAEDPEMCEAIKRRFKIKEFKNLARSDQTAAAPAVKTKRKIVEVAMDIEDVAPAPKKMKKFDTRCSAGCPDDAPCFCAQNAYVGGVIASMAGPQTPMWDMGTPAPPTALTGRPGRLDSYVCK